MLIDQATRNASVDENQNTASVSAKAFPDVLKRFQLVGDERFLQQIRVELV